MKNGCKIFTILILMSMILSLLVSCTPTNESFHKPTDNSENTNEDIDPRAYIPSETEDELTTFLGNLTKDAEDLSEYDAVDYYKDSYFVSEIIPGTEFVLAPGFGGTLETLREFYNRIKHLGYLTVEDKTSVQNFKFELRRDTLSSSMSIRIDDIGYLIKVLDRKDTPMEIKPEYKLVKKSKLLGKDINLYENTSKDLAWIFGSVNIGEFTVGISVYVDSDNKEEIDKINLEQFVWKDYYEEGVNFDD